jgi:hypothetical protein
MNKTEKYVYLILIACCFVALINIKFYAFSMVMASFFLLFSSLETKK